MAETRASAPGTSSAAFLTSSSALSSSKPSAPAFEPLVRDFWRKTYGLPACDSANDAAIADNANSRSRNAGLAYVCDDGNWRKATATEAILGEGCTKARGGVRLTLAGDVSCAEGDWIYSPGHPMVTLRDARDGEQYKTIAVGPQMWMAENLKYDYKVGDASYGSKCHGNDPDSCGQYGRLYTWGAAMDSASTGCGLGSACSSAGTKGICPEGWHLPTLEEWRTLIAFVETAYRFEGHDRGGAGSMLKDGNWTECSHCADPDVPVWNTSKFGALPAGESHVDVDVVSGEGVRANFWTATEDVFDAGQNLSSSSSALTGAVEAHSIQLSHESNGVLDTLRYKQEQFSVRCVQD